MNDESIAPGPRVRIWDLPTRTFHWLLALCVVASIVTARIGGGLMAWHFRAGHAALALLVFRLVWGWVGGHWSRFSTFIYAPATVVRYLRGKSLPHEHHDIGHSPLGALSVFALLGLAAAEVATGLFADDEVAERGPLAHWVSAATSLALTRWHRDWGQWLLVAAVLLHVAAIAYYQVVAGRDLLRPMLSGDKRIALPASVPASVDDARSRALALGLLAACAALAAWVAGLGD